MDSSPEAHPPISAGQSAEHTAELPAVKQESPEPVRMEERPHSHQETVQMIDTAEDEAKQREFIQAMLKAEAAEAVQAENPSPRDIPMEMPVAPPPEPESILHAPPQKKNIIVGMLTQLKDGAVHLFEGLKKLLFSKKTEKPTKTPPISFKNNAKQEGAPISFKQQAAGV